MRMHMKTKLPPLCNCESKVEESAVRLRDRCVLYYTVEDGNFENYRISLTKKGKLEVLPICDVLQNAIN